MSTPMTATLRPGPLGLVIRETRYQQLLFWRNRFGAVFTIVFSSIFLVLLSATNTGHIGALHNIDYAQYYTPGFMAYGVMSACFSNLAISTVIRRETGLLKRLRLSPLPGWALIAAMIVNATLVSVTGAVLLLVIGIVGFGVSLASGSIVPVALAVVVGAVAFSALGLAVSTIVPNEDSAGPSISVVFFLLLFLSGLWFPLTPGSTLAKISNFLPVRRLILATGQPFIGHGTSPWAWSDLLVIAVWGAVGAYLAARRFRWSKWTDNHLPSRRQPA
jgi:ABC-2 type transport system permease protein